MWSHIVTLRFFIIFDCLTLEIYEMGKINGRLENINCNGNYCNADAGYSYYNSFRYNSFYISSYSLIDKDQNIIFIAGHITPSG